MTSQHNNPLLSVILFLFVCVAASGCNSTVNRFLVKSVERIGAPVNPVEQKLIEPIHPTADLAVSWVGHATVLIQIRDKVFLTDPLFTRTVGMVMKRYIEPGLDPSALAKIDYTLISHTHFDHYSYGSLDMLPQNGSLLIPLGALRYTPDFSFREIREMKPWDVVEEDGVRITAVPVQHFSGRYGFDILWMRDQGYTGYVVEYAGKTVFFGGDTGYHPKLFKEIGRRFPHIDLAILPIGPIEPRDFMQRNHIDPQEALQVFYDTGARFMMPMHYRTLLQGFDPSPTFAIEQLRSLALNQGAAERIVDLDIGERRILSRQETITPVTAQ